MALARLIVLALACVIRPHHARCPDGRDLRTGIQRDGRFACWSHPVGSPDDDGTFGRPDRSIQRDDVLEGRLYCGGRTPLVVDFKTVACASIREQHAEQ